MSVSGIPEEDWFCEICLLGQRHVPVLHYSMGGSTYHWKGWQLVGRCRGRKFVLERPVNYTVMGKCVYTHQMDKYGDASIKRRIELPILLMDDVHQNKNEVISSREEPSMGSCDLTEIAEDSWPGQNPSWSLHTRWNLSIWGLHSKEGSSRTLTEGKRFCIIIPILYTKPVSIQEPSTFFVLVVVFILVQCCTPWNHSFFRLLVTFSVEFHRTISSWFKLIT